LNGAERIAIERQRQIDVERYSIDHDDQHDRGEMIDAAVAYCAETTRQTENPLEDPPKLPPACWPWENHAWRPSADRIRNLTKAGALIAAEIDRVLRERRTA